jgi:hypothetical protein
MNSVHLIGRLATDVEVKEVNGGSKVSSFILAVDRNAEEADFAILVKTVDAWSPEPGSSPVRIAWGSAGGSRGRVTPIIANLPAARQRLACSIYGGRCSRRFIDTTSRDEEVAARITRRAPPLEDLFCVTA